MKYSIEKINAILSDIRSGMKVIDIAKKYGIDRRRVYDIKNRNSKSSIEDTTKIVINGAKPTDDVTEKTVTKSSTTFMSLEDIMLSNGLMPSEWEISNLQYNTWEDAKNVKHYQTKFTAIKKRIEIDVELPKPIHHIVSENLPKVNRPKNNIKCAVILPDMQVGFRRINGKLYPIHDRNAMNIALNIVNYLSPDRVILLGDNLDFAELSTKYLTTPDFYFTTQASLVELSWWLSKIRAINSNMKIDYIGGNHDIRLNKYMNEKAIHAYGLKSSFNIKGFPVMSVQNLLGLKELDIDYHDYPSGKVAINSNLVCIHGEVAKGMSGATVGEVVKNARVSTIQGHIHRHEVATKTTWDAFDKNYQYTAASFGCLCKIDPGVVPGMKHYQNWQQGLGVVWYEDSGLEQFRVEFVPIIDNRAIYTSEVFESDCEAKLGDVISNEMGFDIR